MPTRFRSGLVCIVLASSAVSVAADSPSQLAAKLAQQVHDEPRHLQPIDASLVKEKRQWLLNVVNQLEDVLGQRGEAEQLQSLRDAAELPEVLRRMRGAAKDLNQLQQIQAEVNGLPEAARETHALKAVARALEEYLALGEIRQDPDKAAEDLGKKLEELENQLRRYGRQSQQSQPKTLRDIHDLVGWLRLRRQAGQLTEQIRSYYLRPKVRAYVSGDLLNRAIDFPLHLPPVNRVEDGTRVMGRLSTAGRLQVELSPQDEYGALTVFFSNPVRFSGRATRGRISLGVGLTVWQSISKDFRVMAEVPDSEATRGSTRVTCVDTTRGPLIDRVVERVVRRSLDGGEVSAKLGREIDVTAELLGNLVNLETVLLLKQLAADRRYILERCYRTTDRGLELTVLSSFDGLAEPLQTPKTDSDDDLVVSLHKSLAASLWHLLAQQPEELKAGLRGVLDLLDLDARFQVPSDDGKVAVEFWLPAENDAVSIGDKQVTLRVLARRPNAPKQPTYRCQVTLSQAPAAGTHPSASPVPVEIDVQGGGDEKDREDLKKTLRELARAKLERCGLQLPVPDRLQDRQEGLRPLPVQLSLRRVEVERGYLTVAAQLK